MWKELIRFLCILELNCRIGNIKCNLSTSRSFPQIRNITLLDSNEVVSHTVKQNRGIFQIWWKYFWKTHSWDGVSNEYNKKNYLYNDLVNINLITYYGSIMKFYTTIIKQEQLQYLCNRIYIHLLQQICGLKMGFYVRIINKKTLQTIRWVHEVNRKDWNLWKILRRVKIAYISIYYLIWAIEIRNIDAVVITLRHILLKLKVMKSVQFLFILQLLLKKLFYILVSYCGLKSYKIEITGKISRRGLQRSNKYVLMKGLSKTTDIHMYCYKYLQVRWTLGAIGLKGLLIY